MQGSAWSVLRPKMESFWATRSFGLLSKPVRVMRPVITMPPGGYGEETLMAVAAGENPWHSSAVVVVDKRSGIIEIVTDVRATVPLYIASVAGHSIVSSSPDLIASVTSRGFDRLSAVEKLSTGAISFPYTLYDSVEQVPPASRVAVTGCSRRTRSWWNAPEPEAEKSFEVFREELHDFVRDALSRVAMRHSERPGTFTLSAGLDSRLLLTLARDIPFGPEIRAVNLATGNNRQRATAQRVADVLGVPVDLRTRPIDHYARVFLADSPALSSSLSLDGVHFGHRALGDLQEETFLIGGYGADLTLLGATDERDVALWVATGMSGDARIGHGGRGAVAVTPSDADRIRQRRDEAEESLGLHARMPLEARCQQPASIRLDLMHLSAAQRNYPMYEPFMTRPAAEFLFRVPETMRATTTKDAWYSPHLVASRSVASNPPGPIPKPVGRLAKVLLPARLRRSIRERLPDSVSRNGEWTDAVGPLQPVLEERVSQAMARLRVGGNFVFAPDLIADRFAVARVVATDAAWRRST